MTARLPRMRANEVDKVLQCHGFTLVSQKGSHQKWRNETTAKQVIVPYHEERQLPLGTLHHIAEGSGIPHEELHC